MKTLISKHHAKFDTIDIEVGCIILFFFSKINCTLVVVKCKHSSIKGRSPTGLIRKNIILFVKGSTNTIYWINTDRLKRSWQTLWKMRWEKMPFDLLLISFLSFTHKILYKLSVLKTVWTFTIYCLCLTAHDRSDLYFIVVEKVKILHFRDGDKSWWYSILYHSIAIYIMLTFNLWFWYSQLTCHQLFCLSCKPSSV